MKLVGDAGDRGGDDANLQRGEKSAQKDGDHDQEERQAGHILGSLALAIFLLVGRLRRYRGAVAGAW